MALFAAVAARGYLVFILAMAASAVIPMIAGMTATMVHGTSMEPRIVAGDIVLSSPFDQADEIPLGRVISFEAPEESGRSGLVLHRIVALNHDGSIVTAGDNNEDADNWQLEKTDVISVARLLIPYVGLPALWVQDGDVVAFSLWALITIAALTAEILITRSERPRDRIRRHRHAGRAAVATFTILALPTALPAVGSADAAFTDQTSSVGNAWTAWTTGPATRLTFASNPSGSTGGTAFGTQPVVTVENAAGDTKSGTRTITLTITSPRGARLTCATNAIVTDTGTATFSGCAIDRAGTYMLTATSDSLTPAVSTTVVITTGAATRLAFAASPSGSNANSAFPTQPVVKVTDAGGNVVRVGIPIALSISTGAGTGAKLICATNPVRTSAGSAAFSGCRIDRGGTYTLTATSGTLTPAMSAPFAISPAPPLTCSSSIWMATFRWTPTPYVATRYNLYINGVSVPATGADGWNSYVQLMSSNVPASRFPAGSATVEVRKVLSDGSEQFIGAGTVVLGPADHRTYTCT
ncbi:signal peptidase I [Herbiconiux sp. P15]|uniref:signal peptidase I n=1 Tax=Herbiconiux liukaitaii TaxID=3342799 RepID=UPI0035B7188B